MWGCRFISVEEYLHQPPWLSKHFQTSVWYFHRQFWPWCSRALPISGIQDRIGTIGSIRPNGIDQLRFSKHHWCPFVCPMGMGFILWSLASSRSHVIGIGCVYHTSNCLQGVVESLPIWPVGMAMAFTDLLQQTTFPKEIIGRFFVNTKIIDTFTP